MGRNADPRIAHFNRPELIIHLVKRDLHLSNLRKPDRIADQIRDDLIQPAAVTDQFWWQRRIEFDAEAQPLLVRQTPQPRLDTLAHFAWRKRLRDQLRPPRF